MQKINIVICDDDPGCASLLREQLERLCREYEAEPRFRVFTDGLELAEKWPGGTDILFLDVEMPLMDGIEAGKEIRKLDAQVTILFTTLHEKYAVHGYEVNAYRYLLKPIEYEALRSALSGRLPMILSDKRQKLYVKCEEGVRCIAPAEILYVETVQSHHVRIHTRREALKASRNLNEIEQMLSDSRFFKCHTSYLVNLDFIERFDRFSVVMPGGAVIPVSKYRKRELMEAAARRAGSIF